MMKYTFVDNSDIEGLEKVFGVSVVYLELDEKNRVLREVGVDASGEIVHVFPAKKGEYGRYGIFDSQTVSASSEVDPLFFRELWDKALR
ncbi:hypothetical protein MA04_02733 [Alcanivorax balearicus MACL04]|uniref:Uncharacterized protein n=1 Tax=Alloalcanivorax balearicus MACL04 TaxID=1177182 RepID=A0ABT2R0Y3_9GAMM|nr:hypothetical protein [Alloalcanivorax balearicus]MCU5783433.1 hypothetical protein [Alloalcanivorax balearicus MACL04]